MRIPDNVKRAFQEASPKGWRVESIQYMPVLGWDSDLYVCRITDGLSLRYLETDHGRVKNSSKTLLKERLKAYRELLNLGEAWLG